MQPLETPRARRRLPWRLGALTLAVLGAHLLLLADVPRAWSVSAAPGTRAVPMMTRTLTVPPAPPAVVTPPGGAARPPSPRGQAAPASPGMAPDPGVPEVGAPEAGAAPGSHPADTPTAPATAPHGTAAAVTPAQPAPSAEPRHEPATDIGAVVVAPPTRLNYEVSASTRGLSYSAQAQLLWQHDGAQYDAQLTVSAFLVGSRTQTSAGQLTAQGLAPLRFADRRRGERAAHFDRARQRITFSANTPDAPLLPGAQDRLSLFLQLGALIAGAPERHGPGTTITVQTAATRDAEPWLFTVQAPVRLRLAGQSLDTVPLVRQPRHEHDTRVEIWLAPSIHYLPARLRITQAEGDLLDLQLTDATPLAANR